MKSILRRQRTCIFRSHPARGAWIEIVKDILVGFAAVVAPRKGCVD